MTHKSSISFPEAVWFHLPSFTFWSANPAVNVSQPMVAMVARPMAIRDGGDLTMK